MRKIGILLCGALLAAGLLVPTSVEVARADGEKTPSQQLHDLVVEYLGSGEYTKKTTIGLNKTCRDELSHFHNKLNDVNRTTYYSGQKLLLAAADGTVKIGDGSYCCDGTNVFRTHATEAMTETVDFTKLADPCDFIQKAATSLEECYVTLNSFAATNYFDSWGVNEGTYYYDIKESELGPQGDVYKCAMWNDFQSFCAPMLYIQPEYITGLKSLTIEEHFDAEGREYLQLSMFLKGETDLGKLEKTYLAQARIYKGLEIFEEDFESFYLVKNGVISEKLTVSTEEGKHESFIKNVALAKGDVIKLWSGDDKYYGCSKGVEHNLTVGISTDTKLRDSVDNYVACEAANFDIYAKFDANGKYIGMYIHDQAARTIYCEANWDDINSGKMWAHYWGDNVIGSVFDYKPQMVYDHKTGYNKDCNKVVIPGAATSIKFCYNKTTGEFVESENQTLGENNAYFFDKWNEGTPKMGSYKYSA